jgi:hypothetical protein
MADEPNKPNDAARAVEPSKFSEQHDVEKLAGLIEPGPSAVDPLTQNAAIQLVTHHLNGNRNVTVVNLRGVMFGAAPLGDFTITIQATPKG